MLSDDHSSVEPVGDAAPAYLKRVGLIQPIVLNPREAAKYIGVGRTKFFELLKDGHIPMKKSGKHTLVKVTDLDAWIDGLPNERKAS